MPAQQESRKLIAHIAARMGGVDKLAAKLNVSPRVISLYLNGRKPIPDTLVLQVVDLIIDELDRVKIPEVRNPPAPGSPQNSDPISDPI